MRPRHTYDVIHIEWATDGPRFIWEGDTGVVYVTAEFLQMLPGLPLWEGLRVGTFFNVGPYTLKVVEIDRDNRRLFAQATEG